VTDGRPLDYLVPEPVIDIIRDRGLYGLRVGSQL
jgi:nicotinic acid mononucleotide adenylyltransferase